MSFFKTHSHKIISYSIIAVISVFIVVASFWYKSQRVQEDLQRTSMFSMFVQKQELGIHEKKDGYEINVEYPQFKDEGSGAVNEMLRVTYRAKVHDFVVGAQETFVEASKHEDMKNMASYYTSSFEEIAETERCAALLVSEEFYTLGAAHPLSGRETYIYDKKQKRLVTTSELFTASSSYLVTLSKLSREAFIVDTKNTQGIDIDTSLENHGFDAVDSNFSRILPTREGLMIYFEVYQIGPYTAGLQQVLVPYEKLASLLNKDGVLGEYSK